MLKGLNFRPGFAFLKDISLVEFLNRLKSGELGLREQELF